LLFIRKDKNLTASITFILSRRGRERMKGKLFQRTLTLALSRGVERE
jgi:hypothetical protein